MQAIYHSNVFTTVNRVSETQILAQCVLLSTDIEAVGRMTASPSTFRVEEASWEIYRSPGSSLNGSGVAAELTGVEAYRGAGGALGNVARTAGEVPRQLLADCVKGIIQSETYLFRDRGFATAEDYQAFWKEKYEGSCRLYSNLERVTSEWYEHVADRMWGPLLFSRCKTAIISRDGTGSLLAIASFIDSFHEISVRMETTGDVISVCSGKFLRAPDNVCRENESRMATLEGRNITELTKKDLTKQVGGSQGCDHVADVSAHIVSALRQAQESL